MERPTFDDYTYLNRLGLTFLGIWRDEEWRVRDLARKVHLGILFALMTMLLVPEWLDMYVLKGNISANAETFVLFVFTMTALLKLVNFISVADVFEVIPNYECSIIVLFKIT